MICSTNGFLLYGSTVLDLKERIEKAIELSDNEYTKMARNAYETKKKIFLAMKEINALH